MDNLESFLAITRVAIQTGRYAAKIRNFLTHYNTQAVQHRRNLGIEDDPVVKRETKRMVLLPFPLDTLYGNYTLRKNRYADE